MTNETKIPTNLTLKGQLVILRPSTEAFYENNKFVDDAIYALFEKIWPIVKAKLKDRIAQQI